MSRRYAILDVFTDRRLAGNPLAVVLDAEGLDDRAMQKIAAEFNLSETVFVFPADQPGLTARVRIFTPARELPFAGHPTVGTAVYLAKPRCELIGGDCKAVIVLGEQVGPVRCGVRLAADGSVGSAEFDLPKKPRFVRGGGSVEAIAAALDLDPRDIGCENHVPTVFEAGVPFAFVPVRDLDAAARARPVPQLWGAAFAEDAPSAFVYCRETVRHDAAFHARMFAPDMGIGEDPATGAAAAAFAGVVQRFDSLPEGRHATPIEQGVEMGRPSFIRLEIEIQRGQIQTARIGGQAVLVAEGTLFV